MKQDTNHFSNSNENQNVTFEELHIRHLKLLIDLKIKKLNNWFLKMAIINTFDDLKIFLNHLKKNKHKCIIAIETGGMFDRLVENGFDETHDAILVHIKGQPARSTRRFLQRLHKASKLPLLLFTDADPWSYRIYSSVAYGAIKTAHISHILATPSARYLGVTPSDIINYELPSDDLNDRDISALKSIQSDPRFKSKYWRGEIELQLELGKKSEQQALAKYGLDFVTSTYLPDKLKEMNIG